MLLQKKGSEEEGGSEEGKETKLKKWLKNEVLRKGCGDMFLESSE